MPRKKVETSNNTNEEVKVPKKRGRKPKGGKIVSKNINLAEDVNLFSNVIVHLKCVKSNVNNNDCDFLSSMQYNPLMENVESFSINSSKELSYEVLENNDPVENKTVTNNNIQVENQEITNNSIWKKIKELDTIFRLNMDQKKSSCFWCTCEYDNPTIYIPSIYVNKKYVVYGNFCSPECACAYLFNEHIDDSVKYERYHLLNYIYSKIYDYSRNIKPAPNPLYILDKFMGSLTIQEYRKLLTHERLLLVIDKPLTKMMPELHEDNNEHNSIGDYKYKLKKKSEKVVKNDILSKHFSVN
jgi:hypothetical protein